MSHKLKNLYLVIGTFILIVLFTPFFGGVYENIIGRKISSGFWGPSHPEYFEGFFISYAFFVTMSLMLFIKSKKYNYLLYLLGALIILNVISNTWESLIANIAVALIGYLLAQLILLVYKKFKK